MFVGLATSSRQTHFRSNVELDVCGHRYYCLIWTWTIINSSTQKPGQKPLHRNKLQLRSSVLRSICAALSITLFFLPSFRFIFYLVALCICPINLIFNLIVPLLNFEFVLLIYLIVALFSRLKLLQTAAVFEFSRHFHLNAFATQWAVPTATTSFKFQIH